MTAVLANTADPLPRLVLADYLDDTGIPANAAWAEYLRLRAAIADEVSAITRELMRDAAATVAPQILAGLTLKADDFLADVPGFLNLLPSERFTLRLSDYTPPRRPHGPDLCRLNRGVPLGEGNGQTVVGLIPEATEQHRDTWNNFYRPVLFVRIRTEELEPALQRAYTPRTLFLDQPQVAATPVLPTLDEQLGAASAAMKRRYLEQLIAQARERGASAIDITAYATHHWIRRIEGGRSLRWHRVGTALGRELVLAARALAARPLQIRVRQRNSSFGDGVRIVLLNPPTVSSVLTPT